MVPAENVAFFTNSSIAAGALIGLLFVVLTLRSDSLTGESASARGRALAGSSFTSLVNAFFISIMATIPHIGLGLVVIVMGIVSLWNTGRLHRRLVQHDAQIVVLVFSVLAYVVQIGGGFWLAVRPHEQSLYDTLSYLIVSSFAIVLARAWALLQGNHLVENSKL